MKLLAVILWAVQCCSIWFAASLPVSIGKSVCFLLSMIIAGVACGLVLGRKP